MMEKNRDILKRALNDLPEHKADPATWAGLSVSLENRDATRFIQNNKAGLPDHRAPASIWKGIEQGLNASFWSGTAGLLVKISSIVVITASVVSAVLFFNSPEEIQESAEDQKFLTNPQKVPENPSEPAPQDKNTFNVVHPNTNDQASISSAPVIKLDDTMAATTPVKKTVIPSPDQQDSETLTEENTGYINMTEALWLPRQRASKTVLFGDRELPGNAFPIMVASSKHHLSNDYYAEKRRFDISLGGSYGWMHYNKLNPGNMEIPNSVHSVGVDVLFEKDYFYLKAGMSYSTWEESAGYEFRYNKNEVVYEYLYVDSASYIPGTNILTYHTTEQEVYDSVYHEKPDAIRSRYKVLRVPLIFGYKLVESRKWMIGFNVGVSADINIGKNVITPVFSESQSSLVGVENHMVSRSAVNWHLLAGAGVFYRMSNRFSIFLEPDYNVYLNTVYPGTGLSNLSFFEIKFGILYRF